MWLRLAGLDRRVCRRRNAGPKMLPELAAAIRNDDLFLLYQPQVSADGRTLVSAEALVRWRDSQRGIVEPENFVPQAERHGLIDDLGSWVLEHACRDAAQWRGISVAVNVSPLQFRRPDFVAFISDMVRRSGLAFDRLELEITESAYFDDPDSAEASMRELRALGMSLALDDFGTGYASLSSLRRLPLDRIKIDKSFVAEIGDPRGAEIVRAVVALARALGLRVTAEGVETAMQQRFLAECGCDVLQGYLFARPAEAARLPSVQCDLLERFA